MWQTPRLAPLAEEKVGSAPVAMAPSRMDTAPHATALA
jgi:hypothetical protein